MNLGTIWTRVNASGALLEASGDHCEIFGCQGEAIGGPVAQNASRKRGLLLERPGNVGAVGP